MIILVLVVVAAVTAAVVELSSTVRSEFGEALMHRTADRVETSFRDKLDKFFIPLQSLLAVVERWGERGVLDLSDHRALNGLFIPMIEQYPWVTSMLIATDGGVEYMLLKEDSTWVTRETDVGGSPGRVRWRRWSDEDSLVAEWEESMDYDPRRRPWYIAAVEDLRRDERGICWTEPYAFYTTGQVGVTLSKKWRTSGEDGALHVAGVDVPLESILDFVGDLVTARDGFSFLLNDELNVIDVGGEDGAVERAPTDLEASFIESWRGAGSALETPLSVLSGGQRWWVDFRAASNDTTPLWLAVAAPESAFAGEVRGRQHRYALVVAGLLLAGILLTVLGTQIRLGAAEEGIDLSTEDAILDLIAKGEGERLEFKSTLRWNVNADKPGKEVEISWLKTVVAYLNSDGGVLLIGVNDEGEVTGIDADRFASDDKFLLHYNNLFKEHIGVEFAVYVDAAIVSVAGKKVFVVQCRKAADPVYLKHGKDEKYYVRVGPASRALSMSQVVERVRKKS